MRPYESTRTKEQILTVREDVMRTLRRDGWSVMEIAWLLNVTQQTVYRNLRKHVPIKNIQLCLHVTKQSRTMSERTIRRWSTVKTTSKA